VCTYAKKFAKIHANCMKLNFIIKKLSEDLFDAFVSLRTGFYERISEWKMNGTIRKCSSRAFQ
jgi:hypothetical protein